MSESKRIKTALVSVYHKEGSCQQEELVSLLNHWDILVRQWKI